MSTRTLSCLVVPLALTLLHGWADAKPAQTPPGKGIAAQPTSKSAAAPSPAGVVNLNTATEEQLCLLPRIGPSKARAIIKFRGKQKFKTPSDLVNVKGIGRKTYRRMRPYLTVQGETTLTSKAKLVDESGS
jgi:competence protein ComEA